MESRLALLKQFVILPLGNTYPTHVMNKNCPVCGAIFCDFEIVAIRGKYFSKMLQCPGCGFMTYDDVCWLEEAYERPINPSDVGYVFRNVQFAEILSKLLHENRIVEKFFLDYGSGYGMFVRLMRDRGYHFHSLDPYCESLFAQHTTACRKRFGKYQLITAFEVFEHLVDPIASLVEMLKFGDAVLFTTDLVPAPTPPAADWDYYGFEHGQHISLWTPKSLELLAAKFGLSYSNLSWISPSWHLIAPSSHYLHTPWRKKDPRWLSLIKRLIRRGKEDAYLPSLMMRDYHYVVALEGKATENGQWNPDPHLDEDLEKYQIHEDL